jgi:hypothetical protein
MADCHALLMSPEFDEVKSVLADVLDHLKVPPGEREEALADFSAH